MEPDSDWPNRDYITDRELLVLFNRTTADGERGRPVAQQAEYDALISYHVQKGTPGSTGVAETP